jgi:hypothetical protein
MLQTQVPDIIKAIHKQLKEKSVKTRQGCFSLLTELVIVLPDGYHKCLYGTALREYDGTCLNQTLNKTKSCINQTLICLVFEISVEIDCTNQTRF